MNNELKFGAVRIFWRVEDIELITTKYKGKDIEVFIFDYVHKELKIKDSIPTEFFNHQLLEVNTNDKAQLLEFVKKWGLPLSPLRIDYFCLTENCDYVLNGDSGVKEKASAIVRKTRKAIKESDGNNEVSHAFRRCISLNEVRLTIELLQETSKAVIKSVLSKEPLEERYLRVINAGSCNEYVIVNRGTRTSEQFAKLDLTNAICNQLVATIADTRADWKMCACGGCGRIFKRKQSENKTHDRDSMYCSVKCKNREKKRKQRESAKNRIDHGI